MASTICRLKIQVSGIVQGVGFRPFIYQLAKRCGVTGWVCNTGDGVLIEAEGDEGELDRFVRAISAEAPSLALVSEVLTETLDPTGYDDFRILGSRNGTGTQTTIPPDIATCPDCIADTSTPDNRRHRYPFTNCTNCGPRFTIIRGIPYDRPQTTMASFDMCPECRREYEDPGDRRFHAQPNACPVCGPHLSLDGRDADDSEIITTTARLLHEGKVLAIKGLGGFHLACDARNDEAVRTLRERKGRGGKPFALMCADIEEVRRICQVDPESEKLLLSPERPIVLMQARPNSGISPLVALGINSLGVMLPYTPLHQLLLAESPKSLVMTSGNLSEEPIVHLDEEAFEKLGNIADHMLTHNRPIHMACDDSVTRVHEGVPMIIRRARGYVPRPIDVGMTLPQILACGADLKSTFCLTKGKLALISQHLGDLDNAPTLEHYQQVSEHFQRFFDVRPEIVAHDMHPDYRSTRFAQSLGSPQVIPVQHHHAHIASCMAENKLDGEVIGVALDGTGYGTDGCIWGGEFMVADYEGFQRAAHLSYVPIPGGEAAIKRPGRMALSYLLQAFGDSLESGLVPGLSPEEEYAVRAQIERGLNAPLTSSAGRLFDAVSALLGICPDVTYEGQAAIELEGISAGPTEQSYNYEIIHGSLGEMEIDMRPTIRDIVGDIRSGEGVGIISSRFHSTVAQAVTDVCSRIAANTGLSRVALSGGVFQNVLLLSMVIEKLRGRGLEVFRHSLVPTNDGGVSLGQAVIAARRVKG